MDGVFNSAGGAGGAPGAPGGNGVSSVVFNYMLGSNDYYKGAGGGGRIVTGSRVAATLDAGINPGGNAGGPGATFVNSIQSYTAGYGGASTEAGGNAGAYGGAGGGGGFGRSGGTASNDQYTSYTVVAPGAGGKAIHLNGSSVNWLGGNNTSQVLGVVN